jgi:iron(II)-dependent oxidoreductase
MIDPAKAGKVQLSPADRKRRKRFLSATLFTCIALVMIGSSMHVVQLGSNRMTDMRNMAGYDLKEEASHIRAAGEDIALHESNEHGKTHVAGYTVAEANALLGAEKWRDLDTTVVIPAGPFVAGSDLERADVQDKPQHSVTLPAYRIDKYLVTNAQFARFVAATGHRPPLHWKSGKIPEGELLHPVTMVNWHDAAAYAKWAGKRLPYEMEWEKAARGTDGRRWPWGNGMDPTRLNTYYNVGAATKVDTYPRGASPYGVLDMAGNVNQWMEDDFVPYEGSDAPAELFQGKVAQTLSAQDRAMKMSDQVVVNKLYKVLRGGSWKGDPFSTASYHRHYSMPNYASDFYGFRCAADVGEQHK